MSLVSFDKIPKKSLFPWNEQQCYQDTGLAKYKQHSSFTRDKLACLEATLTQTITDAGVQADTVKDVRTFLLKADQANPVATATVPTDQVMAIDISNRSFDQAIRVKVTLETGSGDVDRYFVLDSEEYLQARFNSDTIKAIEMDVLNGSIDAQATASGIEAASLVVHTGGTFPAATDVVAKITIINA